MLAPSLFFRILEIDMLLLCDGRIFFYLAPQTAVAALFLSDYFGNDKAYIRTYTAHFAELLHTKVVVFPPPKTD